MQTMFDSTRIKEAEALFAELLNLPAPEREKQLLTRCGGNAPLADLVRQLLKHDDSGMGGFLAAPAGADGRAAPGWQPLPDNTRIGNFQLLRRIGEGGMGIVYEARQAHPDRIVALKVIRGGRFIDRYAVKLFEREVQALARLRHPCIGAIYEAGGTDDEQHYFAMEMVHGRPLMEYVRETGLGRRERLALFCKVCDAVHYAHQRGVMHRDLKPSNIMIDADGLPRVLDFGLARITDAELGSDVSRTAPGRIQGTLSYMSPEQARGDSNEIDTRSDVYSLGVILYELLTDRLPYDVLELPLPRAVETISNHAPRKTDALKGDLETIALRALEKQPQRRYASAAALGEDVHRFLTRQPILARPASALYQLRKLVARHRWPSAFAATVLVLLVGFGVWMSFLYQAQRREWQRAENEARRANEETQRALGEQEKTARFASFMEQILEGARPSVALGRDTKMLKEMMDSAAKRLESGELAGLPAAEFRLRNTIAEVYLAISELDGAKRMTDPMRDLAARAHGAKSVEYAEALESEAAWLHAAGRYKEALARAEEALAINRAVHTGDHDEVAANLNRIGTFLAELARYDEAAVRAKEALAMYQRLHPGDYKETAIVLDNLAGALFQTSSPAAALPLCEQALAMYRRLYPGDHPDVAGAINTLAYGYGMLGRNANALPLLEESVEMNKRLYAQDHPYVAMGLTNLAMLLIHLGRTAEALPKAEEALAMHRRLYPGDHPSVAVSLNHVASTLQYLGRYKDALPIAEESLAMRQRLFPEGHHEVAQSLSQVASQLKYLGRLPEALAKHEEALAMFKRVIPDDHPETAQTISHVGHDLQLLGRYADAVVKLEEGLAMYQRLFPGDHPEVASALNNVASGYLSTGQPAKALEICDVGLAMSRKIFPPGHPLLCAAEIRKGSILVALERYADAEAILVPTWKLIADRPEIAPKAKATCLESLAKLYAEMNKNDPQKGHAARAEEYRARLNKLQP